MTAQDEQDWAEVLGFDRLPEHIVGKRATELMDLSGKKAFVTGAGGDGLGQAIANRLAGLGADIALIGRTLEKVERRGREIEERWGVKTVAAEAVVVGRSVLVGKPMAQLLLERNATVTICHSRTRDLTARCRQADVLVVAAGRPAMIGADAVAPGATVIDVGIHRTEQGLRGDVDAGPVSEVAGLLSPVPGGVGPMTIAMLLANTLTAATAAAGSMVES